MNTAAKVRHEKEQYPERFCPDKRCLWRIWTREGAKPCPKHSDTTAEHKAEQRLYRQGRL
jgi:hypothetical protein